MRAGLLSLVFLLITLCSFSQESDGFKELKAFSQQKSILPADSSLYLDLYFQKGLHYLSPFYKAFYQRDRLIKADTALYYDNLSQASAFAGDYASALAMEKETRVSPDDSTKLEINQLTELAKESVYTDAHKYLLSRTRNSRVVMLNEATNKPLHRAFAASLLEDLYKQGFRYLAMEMLDNTGSNAVTRVNLLTGYFCAEPVAGELIRKALELGYILVPYEDNNTRHTPNQREYAQAHNLYDFLQKKDTTAKMLVYASYAHIEEGARSDNRIPMAAYFKIISGIDPLTIDQTEMTESGNNSYTSLFYETWRHKNPLTSSVVPLKNEKAIDPFGFNLYDIHIIHPPTKFTNNRPVWMTMGGWKKEIPVEPVYKSLFMIQAYYDKEYTEATVTKSVPADQTYTDAANGYYYLYLHKGKYKLVFRDKEYAILGTKDIVVY